MNDLVCSIQTKNTNHGQCFLEHQTINARVLEINFEKLSVYLTCRTSDLLDEHNEFKAKKDADYDYNLELSDKKQDEESNKKKNGQTLINRICTHSSFDNIDNAEAEKKLAYLSKLF